MKEDYEHFLVSTSSFSILLILSIIDVQIYENLESGKPSLQLLYVTPELIATSGFMSKLMKIHGRGLLNLIAIDEV